MGDVQLMVWQDGFEQISRLHGLDRCIRECMVCKSLSPSRHLHT